MSYETEIAAKIKDARLNNNMTLKELGVKIGISEGMMQRYESGSVKGLKLDKIKDIATALSVKPEWLMGWEPKQERKFIEVTDLTDDEIDDIKKYMSFLLNKRG